MAVVQASLTWPGSMVDVLQLFVEPTPTLWGAEFVTDAVTIFRELDQREDPTPRIAGLEIVGFLAFDDWSSLPKFPLLWQLAGREPLPLDDLLARVQQELRHTIPAKTR